MSFSELIEKYGSSLLKGLYPVAGGLISAMLVSSFIYYKQYRPEIQKVYYRPAMKSARFNVNRAITEILNRNVMGLKIKEESGRKSTNKGSTPISLKDVTLLGVFLGHKQVAVVKSGDELLYLRPGDRLSGYRVVSLGFNSVLLEGKRGRYVLTFPEEEKPGKGFSKKTEGAQRNLTPPSEDRVVVKRQEVLEKAKDLNKLLTTTRIAPYYIKGQFIGYRLAMLRKGTFLYKLGLRPGDIIKRINGEDVSSPERLVEMLSKLDTVTAVNIDMLRGGKKKTLFIEIED